MERTYQSQWLGNLPYGEGLEYQADLQKKIKTGQSEPVVLGLEHPNVVTLGKRGGRVDLKATPEEIAERGFELFSVDRGGQATLHNPGQLVIYPLIPLRKWSLGAKAYLALLEETTIEAFHGWGVTAFGDRERPGLYTAEGKVAFFGVRISGGVSSHGISINVCNDLSDFALIRPCGQEDLPIISLKPDRSSSLLTSLPTSLSKSLLTRELFDLWIKSFDVCATNLC